MKHCTVVVFEMSLCAQPPAPPKRSSSYEVLKKLRTASRASSSGSRSGSAGSSPDHGTPSPSQLQQEKDDVPADFGSSHFLSSLLHDSSDLKMGASDQQQEEDNKASDVSQGLTVVVASQVDSGAVIEDDVIGDDSSDMPQFVGNLSSLMTSRIEF